jgi:hypothetical protein
LKSFVFLSHVCFCKFYNFSELFLLSFQFERDGYLVFEDFFTPEEVAEMHKAGRHLCVQAPKEDRKVFSGVDQSENQVGVDIMFSHIFLEQRSKVVNDLNFIFRVVRNISSNRVTRFVISSRKVLLIRTMSCSSHRSLH